jgi:outer membrane biosynthesis protein TonB
MDRVGRYDLVGELGRGSSGLVYLGRDAELGREVAVKALAPGLLEEPEALARFRREAELMGQVEHPNVVRVYELLERPGQAFLISEYVRGSSLRAVLGRARRLLPEQALGVAKGGLTGLGRAHQVGVIHRDIKPENVLVDLEGRSKLADFGLAVRRGDPEATREDEALAGSFAYMSPEQLRGEELDQRSDLYSCGVMLHELLTGRLPFRAGSALELLRLHRAGGGPALSAEDLPGPLRELLARALAADPARRHQSVAELLEELEASARAGYGSDWERRASIAALAGASAAAAAALFQGLGAAAPADAAGGSTTAGGATTAGATVPGPPVPPAPATQPLRHVVEHVPRGPGHPPHPHRPQRPEHHDHDDHHKDQKHHHHKHKHHKHHLKHLDDRLQSVRGKLGDGLRALRRPARPALDRPLLALIGLGLLTALAIVVALRGPGRPPAPPTAVQQGAVTAVAVSATPSGAPPAQPPASGLLTSGGGLVGNTPGPVAGATPPPGRAATPQPPASPTPTPSSATPSPRPSATPTPRPPPTPTPTPTPRPSQRPPPPPPPRAVGPIRGCGASCVVVPSSPTPAPPVIQ